MSWKLSNAITVFACLLALAFAKSIPAVSYAQKRPKTPNTGPVAYTTPPKLGIGELKLTGEDAVEIRGMLAYTLTEARYDDTMVGTLVFWIPADVRNKLAKFSKQPLTTIPTVVSRDDMVAGFRKGTSCPTVEIEIGPVEFEASNAQISFKHVTVEMVETTQDIPQDFCVWTRQINANRSHRGVIASLNHLLTMEP